MASFRFTQEYQDLLLACLCSPHAPELEYLVGELKFNYFTGVQATLVARCLLKFRSEYDKFPGWIVLREMVTREVDKLQERDVEAALQYVDSLRELDTRDWEHVRDRVAEFLKERAYYVALTQAVQFMKDDAVPEGGLAPLFEAAARVGQNLDDMGFMFHADVDEVVTKVTSSAYGVATGFPLLDKIWKTGWGPGWLIVPLAPPKRFKSAMCINLACNMISPQIGEDVIYYACEISQELAMVRAMCNMARLSTDYMYETPAKFAAAVKEKMRGAVAGNLLFKSFSSKSASIADIRAHAKLAIRQFNLKPKAIIIDYAETVKGDSDKGDPEYRKSAAVYTGARALGGELGACTIMPDRCNKETTDKPTPSMTSFQGSFEKAGIVDVAFGLCSTADEYRSHILRLFNFLNRHGAAYQHLVGRVDAETWRIEFDAEREYDPDEVDDGGERRSRRKAGGRSGVPSELTD